MKNSVILIPLLFIFLQTSACALIINEIMYDPEGPDTDREWIELLNDTVDTIDLTAWKFFEANTNHGLSSFQGPMAIPSGGYAVIASNPSKFLQDNPSFQGSLMRASFSLSNSGEFLAMKNASGAIQDSLTYIASLGGQDDGSTLSFIGGAWVKGEKTPGAQNILYTRVDIQAATTTSTNTNISTNTNNNSATVPATITPVASYGSDLRVNTVNEKVVLAGADSEFTAQASIAGKKLPESAYFTWSFGDGGSRSGKSVGYHYQYPGVYIAIVEVNADGMIETSKIKVKVIAPEVSISDVGRDIGKNYVEILNNSAYEVDISSWQIGIAGVFYPLPKNTIIAGKQKVRFVGTALGFASTTITSTSTIQLMYPNHGEMLRYVASNTPETAIKSVTTFIENSLSSFPKVGTQVYKKQVKETATTTAIFSTSSVVLLHSEEGGFGLWMKRFFSKF